MRQAMAAAEVGDDVYGEDPTIRRLEDAFAERVGKEASLFVPSGTMGNQIALRLLGRPGTGVLIGRRQHVVIYENAASATNTQAQLDLIDDEDGVLDPVDLRRACEAGEYHQVRPSAVFIENTHMPSGGTPWPLDTLEAVAGVGLPLHLDGARLFNAEVATGIAAARYAAPATTVMCCLSKGLGAPVGSMLAASSDAIAEAREHRQRLGGAMRQVGVLGAAGLVALEHHVDRLADDHRRARQLADAVAARWPDAGLDPERVATNMVIFSPPDARGLLRHLAGEGIRAGTIAPGIVRLVTHLDVDDADVDRAVAALAAAPT
jgi:threonine aldolase